MWVAIAAFSPKALLRMDTATNDSRKRKAAAAFGRKETNKAVIVDTLEKCSRLFRKPKSSQPYVLQTNNYTGSSSHSSDVESWPANEPWIGGSNLCYSQGRIPRSQSQGRDSGNLSVRSVAHPGVTPVLARVHDGDCVALAQELSQQPGAKVWLLNMANARKPGGGARSGSNAQEEHLCRSMLPIFCPH